MPSEELPDYANDTNLGQLSNEQTSQVGEMSKEIIKRETEILRLEGLMEVEEFALNQVQGLKLPELLDSMGIAEIKLKDGSFVEVKKFFSPHISEERKEAAHAWMDANGFGSLIKKVAIVAIDRGDKLALSDLIKWLQDNKYDFAIDEQVNAATLKAMVKGQLESTEEGTPKPPLDLFGIFIAKKAMITGTSKMKPRKYEKKKSKKK